MEEETLTPGPQLMESMRAVGYTPQTSIADIVDNSIAAEAKNVWVDFSSDGEPHIRITDDGRGMDERALIEAMRMAGGNATEPRSSNDLGRFGLGLKTASMAQCRILTVVTKQTGSLHARRWDLDHLARAGSWSLLKLSPSEILALPGLERLASLKSGTLVIWQHLDRMTASIGSEPTALDDAMKNVRDHLALVFHRFMLGPESPQVTIAINSRPIRPIDPFMSNHRSTQIGPPEIIKVEGHSVTIRPFTLPFLNKLTQREREDALLLGHLHDTQGFYVYRGRRLVTWGSWFRIAPRSQLAKLARVQVDIPNALDHLWSLDIKKSTASPPPQVRRELKRLTDRMIEPSTQVQRFRGRKMDQGDLSRIWQLNVDRTTFNYHINRENPAIRALTDGAENSLPRIDALLSLIESSLPFQDIHNRLGQDAVPSPPADPNIRRQVSELWTIYKSSGKSPQHFIDTFSKIEPFSGISNFHEICTEEMM